MNHFRLVFSQAAFGLVMASIPVLCVSQNTPASMSSQSPASTLSSADKKFVNEAAQGGMAEVELGKMATEKASSDAVKQFGQRMVDDHSKANGQLKQIAGSKGIDLPQDVTAKDKVTMARLSKLNGAAFDKAYMADMVKDHKKDVAAFDHASSSGSDSDIKNFASQTLPTLKDHLAEAEKTSNELDNSH